MNILIHKTSNIKALKYIKNIIANLKITTENFKFFTKKANLWA